MRGVIPPLLLLFLLPACGYGPPHDTLPGDVRLLRIQPPSPLRTGEPELPQLLVAHLTRELTRRGIRVKTSGAAGAVLEPTLLDLSLTGTVLSAARGRAVARGLRLEMEFRLRDGKDRTLWRSGLVVSTQTWPLGDNSATSESARGSSLNHLASDAARQCVELMTSGL